MSEDLWDSGEPTVRVPATTSHPEVTGPVDDTAEDDAPGWLGDERLLTPPAKALAAIIISAASLLMSVTGGAIAQIVELDTRTTKPIAIEPGVELFLAFLGAIFALLALRDLVDEPHPWAGTVARAALLVAAVGIVIGLTGVLLALTFHPSFGQ